MDNIIMYKGVIRGHHANEVALFDTLSADNMQSLRDALNTKIKYYQDNSDLFGKYKIVISVEKHTIEFLWTELI